MYLYMGKLFEMHRIPVSIPCQKAEKQPKLCHDDCRQNGRNLMMGPRAGWGRLLYSK